MTTKLEGRGGKALVVGPLYPEKQNLLLERAYEGHHEGVTVGHRQLVSPDPNLLVRLVDVFICVITLTISPRSLDPFYVYFYIVCY